MGYSLREVVTTKYSSLGKYLPLLYSVRQNICFVVPEVALDTRDIVYNTALNISFSVSLITEWKVETVFQTTNYQSITIPNDASFRYFHKQNYDAGMALRRIFRKNKSYLNSLSFSPLF